MIRARLLCTCFVRKFWLYISVSVANTTKGTGCQKMHRLVGHIAKRKYNDGNTT